MVRRWARPVGHVGWWTFVVATLYAGGVYWWGSRQGIGAPMMHNGSWSVYVPLTSGAGYEDIPADTFSFWRATSTDNWHAPSTCALIAFVVVVLAATIEALTARRVGPGIVTVAVPFISLGLFVLATPDTFDGIRLKWELAMSITLVGIAIREVWTRFLLPRAESTRQTSASTRRA